MADGTFVLILLSPGWCTLVHLTWGYDDFKDGSFENSLFGNFFHSFLEINVYVEKKMLASQISMSNLQIWRFALQMRKSVQSPALVRGGVTVAWAPT